MPKVEYPVIGKIGSNDVLDINGFPCLKLGTRAIGVTKIKMVLANLEASRMFLAQYDVPKPAALVARPAVPQPVAVDPTPAPAATQLPPKTKEEAQAELAKLQQLLASFTASSVPAATAGGVPRSNGRFVPA